MPRTKMGRTPSLSLWRMQTRTSLLCKSRGGGFKKNTMGRLRIRDLKLPLREKLTPFLCVSHRLRIAKMNKEMREMDGAFGQSGQSGGRDYSGGGGGAGTGQSKKGFQALRNQLSGWALGGSERVGGT